VRVEVPAVGLDEIAVGALVAVAGGVEQLAVGHTSQDRRRRPDSSLGDLEVA
jgi:hypothetical protein